jgi:hypothetical protein
MELKKVPRRNLAAERDARTLAFHKIQRQASRAVSLRTCHETLSNEVTKHAKGHLHDNTEA